MDDDLHKEEERKHGEENRVVNEGKQKEDIIDGKVTPDSSKEDGEIPNEMKKWGDRVEESELEYVIKERGISLNIKQKHGSRQRS